MMGAMLCRSMPLADDPDLGVGVPREVHIGHTLPQQLLELLLEPHQRIDLRIGSTHHGFSKRSRSDLYISGANRSSS